MNLQFSRAAADGDVGEGDSLRHEVWVLEAAPAPAPAHVPAHQPGHGHLRGAAVAPGHRPRPWHGACVECSNFDIDVMYKRCSQYSEKMLISI